MKRPTTHIDAPANSPTPASQHLKKITHISNTHQRKGPIMKPTGTKTNASYDSFTNPSHSLKGRTHMSTRSSFTVLLATVIVIGLGSAANAAMVTHVATVQESDTDNLSSATSDGTVAPYGGTDWRGWYSPAGNNVATTVQLKDEKKNATNIGDVVVTASTVLGTNVSFPVTWDASDSQSGVGGGGTNYVRINDGTVSGRIDDIGAAGSVWFMVAGWSTTVDTTVELYDSNDNLLDSATNSQGVVSNQSWDLQFSYSGNTDSGSYITYTIDGEVGGTSDDLKFGAVALSVTQQINLIPTPAALPAGLALMGLMGLRRRRTA